MTDRRQRQKELRAAKRAQEQRTASRQEFRRRIVIALLVGVGLVAILLLTSLEGGDESELPIGYTVFREQPTACGGEAPPEWVPRTFEAPEDQATLPATVTITTSCGPIVISLNQDAPETVGSFVFLAQAGFYDGLVFYRVLPNFSISAGDPAGNGSGGAGYGLAGEPPAADFTYAPGVVAMATTGAGASSAFFIVTGADAEVLTPTFSVLGEVIDGMETVQTIAALPLTRAVGGSEQSRPAETVYIESITPGE